MLRRPQVAKPACLRDHSSPCGLRHYRRLSTSAKPNTDKSIVKEKDFGVRRLSTSAEPITDKSSAEQKDLPIRKFMAADPVWEKGKFKKLEDPHVISPAQLRAAPGLGKLLRNLPDSTWRTTLVKEFERLAEGSGFIPEHHQAVRAVRTKFKVLRTAKEVSLWRQKASHARKSEVGLVPTMGALHEGHLRLIRNAATECDEICVSIFVNPTQFGPTEDLATYPKTWAEDKLKIDNLNKELKKEGARGRVTAIFAPGVETMYPGIEAGSPIPTNLSYVLVDPSLTSVLEGAARPTFFRGVTTVVMKLLWIVRPTRAYFGQKDIQQLVVLMRMVRDFCIPTIIRPVWIEREKNGLAMSSRNAYLGDRRTHVARVLKRALYASEIMIRQGVTSRNEVMQAAVSVFNAELQNQKRLPVHQRANFELEYLSMADMYSLQEIADVKDATRCVISAVIVMLPLEAPSGTERLGIDGDKKPVRLLDNIVWFRNRGDNITRARDWQKEESEREDGEEGSNLREDSKPEDGKKGSKSREDSDSKAVEPDDLYK